MVELGEYNLQKSIYEKLTASSTLIAMVSGVFNYVPEGTNFPYIVIAGSTVREFANLAKNGVEYQCLINVFSREAGAKKNYDIVGVIYGILHNGTLTVSGKNIISMKVLNNKLELENDGITYKSSMSISVILLDV